MQGLRVSAPHAVGRLVVLQHAAERALGRGQRAVEHVHKVLAVQVAAGHLGRAQPHLQPPRLRPFTTALSCQQMHETYQKTLRDRPRCEDRCCRIARRHAICGSLKY